MAKTGSKTLTATDFKAKCLRILDNLEPQGLTITKHGRPVARVIPIRATDHDKCYGALKGKIKVKGRIFSTGIKWNAESRHPHGGSLS